MAIIITGCFCQRNPSISSAESKSSPHQSHRSSQPILKAVIPRPSEFKAKFDCGGIFLCHWTHWNVGTRTATFSRNIYDTEDATLVPLPDLTSAQQLPNCEGRSPDPQQPPMQVISVTSAENSYAIRLVSNGAGLDVPTSKRGVHFCRHLRIEDEFSNVPKHWKVIWDQKFIENPNLQLPVVRVPRRILWVGLRLQVLNLSS